MTLNDLRITTATSASRRTGWCFLLVCLVLVSGVAAQEPTFMEAGTHPGARQWYGRAFWRSATWADGAADDTAEFALAYGLTARRALLAKTTLDKGGPEVASLRLRQRIWQRDTGPIDTWRASLQVGGEWFDGRDPGGRAGVVSTTIRGRHGFNAQVDWRGAAPSAYRFEANVSHLYRIYPARYHAGTVGAWYTMVESLNVFDRDGNRVSDAALGLLYEARRWAAEASVYLQEPEEGVRRDQTRLAVGGRYLF